METKDILIGLAIGLFAGLLVGGGVFYFRQSRTDKVEEASPLPTAMPTETEKEEPTATLEPTQAVNKDELSIQILNGSGAPGVAGEARDYLQDLEYENISVGNADSYTYEKTEIYIKEKMKGMVESLVEDLKEEYEVEVQSDYLGKDAEYDVRIILGAS